MASILFSELNEKEFLNSFIFTLQLILQNTKKEDLPFS